jgi:hypothetical protein
MMRGVAMGGNLKRGLALGGSRKMAERWNLKRLTRWDVLVVVAICVAVIVLEPMLGARARKGAERRLCAANLAHIGKVMLTYAGDYEGALPRAGGPTTAWGPTHNWVALNRNVAFGLDATGNGGRASISSSFYLLVKYYEVPTSAFVCRSDKGTTEFDLEKLVGDVPTFTLARAWDFGPPGESCKHCSYSYHLPYGPFALTTSRDPNLAVAADRNPYIESPAGNWSPLALFKPDLPQFRGTDDQARAGNSRTHGLEGQNVLFLDGRVMFEKRAYCGAGDAYMGRDNIYLMSGDPRGGSPLGIVPCPGASQPGNERDSILVHDPPVFPVIRSIEVQPSTETGKSAPPDKSYLPDVHAVGDSIVMDDFESYTDDEGSRIYETWEDGWTNGTGSRVGNLQHPFAEWSIVHAGRQSMPFTYGDGGAFGYSEAQASWRTPMKLAAYGCDVLTLYVRGRAENGSGRFYVGVGDETGCIATVTHPDRQAVNATQWVAWRIPLRDFERGGVDLNRATKICIGVGDRKKPSRSGTGIIYIDDICLSKSSGAAGAGNRSE